MENNKSFTQIINESSLSSDEQNEFINLFDNLDNSGQDFLVLFVENNPQLLEQLYFNIKDKENALNKRDKSMWNQVLQSEYDELVRAIG